MTKIKSLWEVWQNDLPGSYSKADAIESLQKHWNLSLNATYNRMKAGKFTVSDIRFFWKEMYIGFDYEGGFFLDTIAFQRSQEKKERDIAKSFGLIQA